MSSYCSIVFVHQFCHKCLYHFIVLIIPVNRTTYIDYDLVNRLCHNLCMLLSLARLVEYIWKYYMEMLTQTDKIYIYIYIMYYSLPIYFHC